MFTIKDFVAKYEDYTDEELIDIHHKTADYSQEAQGAWKIVIQNKGGLAEAVQKNRVVLIATIVSVLLALIIGQLLYEIIGYKE